MSSPPTTARRPPPEGGQRLRMPPPPARNSNRRSSVGPSSANATSRRNAPPPGGGHSRSATAMPSVNFASPTSPTRRGQPPPGGTRRGPPPPGGVRRPAPPSRSASSLAIPSSKTEASADALDAARRSRSPPSGKRTPKRTVAKSASPASRVKRRSFTQGVPPSPPMGSLVNVAGSAGSPTSIASGRLRPPPPSRNSAGGTNPPSPSQRRQNASKVSQMGPPVTNSINRLTRPPPPSRSSHRRSASMNTLSGKSGANNNNTGSPLPLDPATMVPPPVPADAVNQRLALSAALLLSPGKTSAPPSNDSSAPASHDLSSRGFSSKIPFTKRLGGNSANSPSTGSSSSNSSGKIGGERGRSKSMAFRLGRLAGGGSRDSGSASSTSSSHSTKSDQSSQPAKIGGERGRSRSTAFRLGRRKSSVVLDGARLRATSHNVDISRPDQSYDGKDENDWTQTFSNKLLHKFSLVNSQAEAGLDTVNRATKFLNKFAKLQKEFAANVARAAEHEIELIQKKENFSNKSTTSLLTSSTKGDRMPSSAKANLQFYREVQQYAEIQSTCAQQVESDLATALDNCYKRGIESRKATEEQEKEASERMRRCEASLVKSKQKAQKALAQDLGSEREDSVSDHPKKMNLADFKGKLQGLQRKSALEACTRYDVDVQQANFIQKTYLSYDMPSCLSDLQALEELRMQTLRRNLERFGTLLRQGNISLAEKAKGIEQVISAINPQADLDQFTVDAINQHGEAEVTKPFQYDLKVTVEELMEKHNVSDKNLFGGELSEIMKLPANQGQKVPRIVSALCDAIEAANGFEAEGIFRLSASSDSLSVLRKQLLNNNYSIPKDTSPHACAALVKEFLRGLKSPLVPESLYDQCIRLGLKAKDDPDYHNKPLRFEEMFSKVPEQNKNIIIYLVNYFNRLTAHEDKNRMGVQNLAIVFAPSFLRDSKTASDPLRMMQNAQYESGFVIYLVEYLSNSKTDGIDVRPPPASGTRPQRGPKIVNGVPRPHRPNGIPRTPGAIQAAVNAFGVQPRMNSI